MAIALPKYSACSCHVKSFWVRPATRRSLARYRVQPGSGSQEQGIAADVRRPPIAALSHMIVFPCSPSRLVIPAERLQAREPGPMCPCLALISDAGVHGSRIGSRARRPG